MRPTAVIERRALNRQGRTSADSYKGKHRLHPPSPDRPILLVITDVITSKIRGRAGPMTPPDGQLPAIIEPIAPPALATPVGTYIVPALITDAGGDQAAWRYVEFFAANINTTTRAGPMRASAAGFSPGAKIAGCRSRPFGRSRSNRTAAGPTAHRSRPDHRPDLPRHRHCPTARLPGDAARPLNPDCGA